MNVLTVYGNSLRRIIHKIDTNRDLKPLRGLEWVRDVRDLINWFDVSNTSLSAFTQVCVIEPLMDRVRDDKTASKSLRLQVWGALDRLSD